MTFVNGVWRVAHSQVQIAECQVPTGVLLRRGTEAFGRSAVLFRA